MSIARREVAVSLFAALALAVSASVLGGGAQTAERKAERPQESTSGSAEVFCMAKSAGQLCTHGSAAVLKLDSAKKQRWNEIAQRYNKAVDTATKQLLDEAKEMLSPEEYAQVEKWFDNGLNAQLNRALLTKQR